MKKTKEQCFNIAFRWHMRAFVIKYYRHICGSLYWYNMCLYFLKCSKPQPFEQSGSTTVDLPITNDSDAYWHAIQSPILKNPQDVDLEKLGWKKL